MGERGWVRERPSTIEKSRPYLSEGGKIGGKGIRKSLTRKKRKKLKKKNPIQRGRGKRSLFLQKKGKRGKEKMSGRRRILPLPEKKGGPSKRAKRKKCPQKEGKKMWGEKEGGKTNPFFLGKKEGKGGREESFHPYQEGRAAACHRLRIGRERK